MIRLLIADDHEVVRFGLGQLFAAEPDIEVVGAAADGTEAVELALLEHPDVVLMDLSMPVLDGVSATRQILAADPTIRVLVLTSYSKPSIIHNAFTAGACGYLLKDSPSSALLDGVRAVSRGEQAVAPLVRGVLGDAMPQA